MRSLTMPDSPIVNAMTIDVEDYFHVSAFESVINRDSWDSCDCRVERNVDRLLALLDAADCRATFFTLGWVAERYPGMVRRIVAAGHELASHGYAHGRANRQSREGLREDVLKAKHLLEDISGLHVSGYRAPSFSVGEDSTWIFDILSEAGYKYTSSVYPVKHDHYGWASAPRFPFTLKCGLVEVPVSTVRLFNRNWPAGGGGFFRLLPYSFSRWGIRHINVADRRPAIFYLHPWEIDPDQPRIGSISLKSRLRHYVNLTRTEDRLKRLLGDFAWGRVDAVFLEVALSGGIEATAPVAPLESGRSVANSRCMAGR